MFQCTVVAWETSPNPAVPMSGPLSDGTHVRTSIRKYSGKAGTSQAVVSTFGLLGVGFPALVGAVSDAFGLTAGLGLYAAVPLAILLVLALGRVPRRTIG